jgi:CheY-like chemotaxis protein
MPRILWIDDEIDLFTPHIRMLEARGYDVTRASNGADGVEEVRRAQPDAVLLDEQMPGMGGLETLAAIKEARPAVPVVMVTKSEEEHLMEEALGSQIADYLTKPVNPSQILLTLKRLLDQQRLTGEKVQSDYLQQFGQITAKLGGPLGAAEWTELYRDLVRFDVEISAEEGVRQILDDQYREANRQFGKFIEDVYPDWIAAEGPHADRPTMSHEVVSQFVVPHLRDGKKVVFLVIDCMRYDQWLEFENLVGGLFDVTRDFHYGLLPTATPFSRNAIFSGLLPRDIARLYPQKWYREGDEHSLNQHEEEFLADQLHRKHLKDVRMKYQKIVSTRDGRDLATSAADLSQSDLSALVVNFVDILAHSRSESSVLKEIAPDERAYRALTRTWFEHSWLRQTLESLAEQDVTVVVTTDHGAIRCLHATKVIGDRETSTALRYKHGRQVKADAKHAIVVDEPEAWGLPRMTAGENYIIAKEDYYFVYPTNYNHYLNRYRDTMQHGGASLEEVILPVMTLRGRK